jgi:hypothetical protein
MLKIETEDTKGQIEEHVVELTTEELDILLSSLNGAKKALEKFKD